MAGLTRQRGQGGQGSPGLDPCPCSRGCFSSLAQAGFSFPYREKQAALLSGACPQEVGRFRTLPPDRGMHIKRMREALPMAGMEP